MKKKLFTIALTAIMVVAMAVPTFAATPRSLNNFVNVKLEIASKSDTNQILTVASGGVAGANDPVYTWSDQERDVQRWVIKDYSSGIYTVRPNSAQDLSLNVYRSGNWPCTVYSIAGNSASDYKIKIVDEGGGTIWSKTYGIVAIDHVRALTKTSKVASKFSTGNGFITEWQAPNGQNNQLWYLNEVFN